MNAHDSYPSPGNSAVLEAPADFFEAVYRDAGGDPSRIPWADQRASPALVSWLNTEAAGRLRPGARTVVVGCGLGDDVVELIKRGYDASGFDISPTAIDWARRRFPEHAAAFSTADAAALPPRFRHRFDLVVEVYTIQSVDPSLRDGLAAAVTQIACPRGLILVVAHARDESEPLDHAAGPPYPLSASELLALFEARGWQPTRAPDDFLDDEQPPKRRLRAAFVRA